MSIRKTSQASLLVAALLAGTATLSHAEEFVCPEGARDSGDSPESRPGTVVRWCEIERNGRLLYHGPVWHWYRNGRMEGKQYYLNGSAEGEWQSWHKNGNRAALGTFHDGKKTGEWTYWYKTGIVRSKVDYDGKFNDSVNFYPDGSKRFEGHFWRGGKVGAWVYWGEDGNEKARCDFGEGLFELPDDACRTIAEELGPEGFSRPIPKAVKVDDDRAEIRIASVSYAVTTPPGWIADIEVGGAEGTPLALYPQGGEWRGDTPNIYIRVIFKDGRDFDDIIKSESESFSGNVADYSETPLPEGLTAGNGRIVSKALSYRPLIQTDSPFAIVSKDTIYESVSFLDMSDKLVLMAVLACHSEEQRDGNTRAFRNVVASLVDTR